MAAIVVALKGVLGVPRESGPALRSGPSTVPPEQLQAMRDGNGTVTAARADRQRAAAE